ncbi:MAG: AMP-binding protein [Kiritimatiellaeota bacterium]|nr:AMP-binding protein [Kiritimatiellota bacterium]
MIDRLLARTVRLLLALRYRVTMRGLDAVARRGDRGILFLPNHPALIDPIILLSRLTGRFAPRPLADERQVDRFPVRLLADRLRTIRIPDVVRERARGRSGVEAAVEQCIAALEAGDNVLLYPSGHVYRSRFEDLRGNTAVARILEALPNVRVVLIRTRGLWGSAFSHARGGPPNVAAVLRKGVLRLLANGLFFMPRRRVVIDFDEPGDLPRNAPREELNRFLEEFYNRDAEPNTYVPYSRWERGGIRYLPDPDFSVRADQIETVPAGTRRIVLDYLRSMTGTARIEPEMHLARDLGLDSLARTDLLVWLETEFGFAQPDVEALNTVADVLLAACGRLVSAALEELKPVPPAWFRRRDDARAMVPQEAKRITDAFLAQARRTPARPIIADQIRGVLTYRDIVTALLVLAPRIEAFPGRYVGVMLPASCIADVIYLACLFAGKVPVMINWTAGPRNVRHAVEAAEVRRILTARALLERLAGSGTDLSDLDEYFAPLEDMAASITLPVKLGAWIRARICWTRLRRASVADEAVVLLTSGSESLPKLVPLTHANILCNCRAVLEVAPIRRNDCLLGMLPPFHSFGLTVGMILPLSAGVSVVHYPDPTQGAMLARLIETYKVTLMVGTPTFLAGILRSGGDRRLTSLRLVVTGAEKCPESVYDALETQCPNATILEGYGITECSPVVAVNDPAAPKRGTIGKVLPGLEYAIIDPDNLTPVPRGQRGMLLVRGPSIFNGYMAHSGESPFIEFDGKEWYRTGDLVMEDTAGVLTFAGRLKRFVKLGGEMVSLPAIEAAIEARHGDPEADGPAIAVVPTPDDEHPELILFTTLDLDRETVNRTLRAAGLSGLHNIRDVRRVDEIPVLGTGKTDYRALQSKLPRIG